MGSQIEANLDPVKNSFKSWLGVAGKITPVSLSLPKDLDYGSWAAIGPKLAAAKRFSTWALADWLNWGEQKWGETYTQAADETGLQPDYLSIIKYVASRVDASRRRPTLSFAHHRAVAKLDPAEQERLLFEAEKNGWTRDELARAVAGLEIVPPEGAKDHANETGENNLYCDSYNRPSSNSDNEPEERPLYRHETALAGSLRAKFNRWPVDQRERFFETVELVIEDLRGEKSDTTEATE